MHFLSKRAKAPFVEVNCAAIPEELIESELFGHTKGSFTGASEAKKGKFEAGRWRHPFLDEIGDMTLKTQAKVLRAVEEQCFQPIGAPTGVRVDVRVLAATNKNLPNEIAAGRFPGRSLLPPQRDSLSRPASARAARRHSRPRPLLHAPLLCRPRRPSQGFQRRRAGFNDRLLLARQCSRTA